MPKIDNLFDIMLNNGASDLHLLEGQKPMLRQHGNLVPVEEESVLSHEKMNEYMSEICEPER